MATLYSAAVSKVEKDLDNEDEELIQDEELLGYFNEAIREAEAEVMGIDPDYFLDNAYLPLVDGTSKYDLPTGIYARKIRSIIYTNGSIIYEIKQIRSVKKILERSNLLYVNPTDAYQYIILNNATNGIQIELTPASKETSSTNVTIWFVRKVQDLTGDVADYIDIDIPESTNFIYAYVKGRCKQKENAGSMPPDAQAEIEAQRKIMVDALSNPIPDDDNEVLQDLSFYEEST